jgi:hypothetical protein
MMLLAQVGQAKILKPQKPEADKVCKITEKDRKECKAADRVAVCITDGALKGSVRCDKL